MSNDSSSAKDIQSDSENPVYRGYTRPELEAAFNAVKNKTHWKSSISAVIDAADLDKTDAAVIFFTGGRVTVTKTYKNGRLRIWAAGYWACIGS